MELQKASIMEPQGVSTINPKDPLEYLEQSDQRSRPSAGAQTMTSWNSYKLVDHDATSELALIPVMKSMDIFKKNFEVEVDFISHPTLVVWELSLLEKVKQIRTRSDDKKKGKRGAPPVPRKYTFALAVKEELLFANKVIPVKMQTFMAKALHCESFRRLDLDSGTPSNLLMLYKQSQDQNPSARKLQYAEKTFNMLDLLRSGVPLTEKVVEPSDNCKDIHLSLGSDSKNIPEINRVGVSLDNVPFSSKNPELKNFRIKDVDMKVNASSVFHLYLSLAELGIITKVPPWLSKMRDRATTFIEAHYN